MRKEPRAAAPLQLKDLVDPPRRFRKDAAKLAKLIPGMDPEALAKAMNDAGWTYLRHLGRHWEGSRRTILKKVMRVSKAAEELVSAMWDMGPQGRAIVEKNHSGAYGETTKWLRQVAKLQEEFREEVEDTPFESNGRPEGSTRLKWIARTNLLVDCAHFLEPWSHTNDDTTNRALMVFPPKFARAVHRIMIEPDLPDDSQLFRKEWESSDRSIGPCYDE